jgi:hypothetical protein
VTDHTGHKVTTMRVPGTGARSEVILLCLTCQERIQVLPLCGVRTQHGLPCRNVVRVDLGRTHCLVHGQQFQSEEGTA